MNYSTSTDNLQEQTFSQGQAYKALFDDGQRIGFFRGLRSDADFLLSRQVSNGFIPHQFVNLNPYKMGKLSPKEGGKILRHKGNILRVQGFTVEQDCISKKLQREWFRAVFPDAATVEVDSAGKSIHHHVRFDPAIEIDSKEHKEIIALLKAAFPLSDWGTPFSPIGLVRNPAGRRDGNIQKILYVGRRYSLQEIFERLREATTGFVIGEKLNEARRVVKDWLFDDKEIEEIYKNSKHKPPSERGFVNVGLQELIQAGYKIEPGTLLYRAFLENIPRRKLDETLFQDYLCAAHIAAEQEKKALVQKPGAWPRAQPKKKSSKTVNPGLMQSWRAESAG